MMTKKIIPLVAIALLLIGIVGIVGSIDQASTNGDRYSIAQEKAFDHAKVYMANAVLTHTKGLEEWRGGAVNPEPLILYDINGEKLFYEFSVEKDGKIVGSIKASANQVLGPSIYTLEIGPRSWDASAAIEKAKELAKQKYNVNVLSAKLVVYSYPKIGVMLTLANQTLGKRRIFVDVSDYSIVPDQTPDDSRIGVWSFYESTPKEEKVKRIAQWKQDDKFVSFAMEKANSMGIDLSGTLSENKLKSLEKQISIQAVSQKTLGVPLYGQENSVKCAVASAQMIAKYYGVTHTQTYISSVMGCGVTAGCSNSQQLTYYRGSKGLNKPSSSEDTSPTWEKAKSEIDSNRPLKSGIQGHARVTIGYKSESNMWGSTTKYSYINDPWPVNSGKIYWENWNAACSPGGSPCSTAIINYIYVK